MTSSQLQKDLNYFIYCTMSETNLIDVLKKDLDVKKINYLPTMVDQRWQTHLSEKEQQRINALRYAEGFKITRKTTNPDQLYQNLDYVVTTLGLTLNTNAFLVSIQLIGDDEQAKYWRDQVYSGKVIGAYGQTELGHGSNVKGLQTTATYNEQTQKWIINSPNNTSAKYWPGVLGNFATHSVVQAQTIVKGKNIGVQTFVVEVRDEKLRPVKNVQAFDIGPKLGFQKVDNGALIMNQVELPRNAMLMRYVQVHADGKVQGLENTQAIKYGYGSMLNLRVKLTYNFALGSIIQPTIGLYQILDKQGTANQQQHKKYIIDRLCLGYGIIISNKNTHNIFNSLMSEIKNKNYKQADKLLISCHIISSTFKAVSSRLGMDVVTDLLTYNGIAKFKTTFIPYSYVNYTPSVTYEGDNTVLLQQTAKYLLFKFDTEKDYSKINKSFKNNDWQSAAKAVQFVISEQLKVIKAKIESHGDKGVAFKTIWNQKQQLSLIQISNLWGYMMLLKGISTILASIPKNRQFYSKICAGFTSFLLQKLSILIIYGFTIERTPTWKSFTAQQLSAMIYINLPIQRQPEQMKFHQREGDWLSSKL